MGDNRVLLVERVGRRKFLRQHSIVSAARVSAAAAAAKVRRRRVMDCGGDTERRPLRVARS